MTKLVKVGIAELKKTELDLLTNQVQNAQFDVDELNSVVNSLHQKSNEFQQFLSAAEISQETALSNWNMCKAVISTVDDLQKNSQLVVGQIKASKKNVQNGSLQASTLIRKLMYSADMIDKLANLVYKKKASNPVVSDELVQTLTTATADVNTAIADTLTALKSIYAASDFANESFGLGELQESQASNLLKLLKNTPDDPLIIDGKRLGDLLTSIKNLEEEASKLLNGNSESEDDWFTEVDEHFNSINEITATDLELTQKLAELDVALQQANQDKSTNAKTKKKLKKEFDEVMESLKETRGDLLDVAADASEILLATKGVKISVVEAQKYLGDKKASLHEFEQSILGIKVDILELERSIDDLSNEEWLNAQIRLIFLKLCYERLEIELKIKTELVTAAETILANSNAEFILTKNELAQARAEFDAATKGYQPENTDQPQSLHGLLLKGYVTAKEHYRAALAANNGVTMELDHAQAQLTKATNKLNSLKSGLTAATAAALAA